MIRITIDLDTKSKIKVLYYVAKALYKVKKIKSIEVLKSSSENHHIIIWTNKIYTTKQRIHLRKILGDDSYRLSRDINRDMGTDTLFYKKEPININKILK